MQREKNTQPLPPFPTSGGSSPKSGPHRNTRGAAPAPQKAPQPVKEPLLEVLSGKAEELGISEDECRRIATFVEGLKTKQAINNNLMKLFRDSDKVGKITKAIKPYLKAKS